MLTIRQYTSIHQIEPDHWDSILDEKDIFHRHSFISVVEDSRIENASFNYLLIFDNDKLVATTVLSAFRVYLDLFISKNSIVSGLKKIFPNLFAIKILVCGLPASFGQLNLKLKDKKYASEVCSIIADKMKSIGKKMSISLMTVKELTQAEMKLFHGFEAEGFFGAHSIPYMIMNIQFGSFAEYLSSLRHHYRRRILLSLKKIGQTEPIIMGATGYDPSSSFPALVLAEPGDENSANEFYRKYMAVMRRTTTRLETLNLNFFINLFKQKSEYKLLNLVVRNEVISSAIVIFAGDELIFMLVAKEDNKDLYDSYFNLVYGIIALAIQSGCRGIRMGQTAYWVKQCVGSIPEQESIFFASRQPYVHRMLKFLRHIIFPGMNLRNVEVFRKPAAMYKQPAITEEQFQDA